MYKIIKYQNMLKKNIPTEFLDQKEQNELKKLLKMNEYNIYSPYKDSDKKIFYTTTLPDIVLFEIVTKIKLKHQDILGSLFSLNIESNLFGDILIIDNHYYFYTLDRIKTYIELNLLKIKNSRITLKEVDKDFLKDYEKKYLPINIIASSNRIDIVIARLIKTNREKVKELIKNKQVILNYDILKDNSYKLKENDIFSIRKYGKFKYNKVINNTKKDNIVIEIFKYV